MYDIEYLYEADTVLEAVTLRQAHPDAVIVAGGTDVLVQVREGRLAGRELLSIRGIDALCGVHLEEDGTIRIGSLTTFAQLEEDPLIQAHLGVLAQAAGTVGGPQIRNIGTIGGNTCNGVTSADTASTLLALDATVELTGADGVRRLPLRDFYLGAGKVDLHPDEIQTALLIAKDSYEDCFGSYIKYAMRNAMDIASIACSANVRLSDDRQTILRARLAFGVAGPVPARAPSAEARAAGAPVSAATVEAVAQAVLDDIHPRDSWRASRALRQHVAVEITKRALLRSIELAGGKVS